MHLQTAEALELLGRALHTDRKNVRATMLSGDAQLAQGDTEGALMTWRRVEQQSVPHVALVAGRLMPPPKSLMSLKCRVLRSMPLLA